MYAEVYSIVDGALECNLKREGLTMTPHGYATHVRDVENCPECKTAFEAGRAHGQRIAQEHMDMGAGYEATRQYVLRLPATTRRAGMLAGLLETFFPEE